LIAAGKLPDSPSPERFNLEVLATTDSPLDPLDDHKTIRESGWKARILPTFRPDPVVDPEFEGFAGNIARLGEMTGEDTSTWAGYLNALRGTRLRFRDLGCTATDHGHPTARTANLPTAQAAELFSRVIAGRADAQQQELFRAQMLTEMARMSLEDKLVMQIHPGSARNHNRKLYERYGRDLGADIPMPTNYVDHRIACHSDLTPRARQQIAHRERDRKVINDVYAGGQTATRFALCSMSSAMSAASGASSRL